MAGSGGEGVGANSELRKLVPGGPGEGRWRGLVLARQPTRGPFPGAASLTPDPPPSIGPVGRPHAAAVTLQAGSAVAGRLEGMAPSGAGSVAKSQRARAHALLGSMGTGGVSRLGAAVSQCP